MEGESRAREPPKRREARRQTYLRSAEWAAMRFLRLLSARGQPERLKEKRWDIGVSQRGAEEEKGRPTTQHPGQPGPEQGRTCGERHSSR